MRTEIKGTKGYVSLSRTHNITAEDHNGLDVNSMVIVEVKGGKFTLSR